MKKKILGLFIVFLFIIIIIFPVITGIYKIDSDYKTNNIVGDLIAYWSFDEYSDQILDESGNRHNAVNYGATWISDGLKGGALSFDGIYDYVQVPDVSDFLFANEDITYSVWVQIRDNSDLYYPFIALNDYIDNAPAYLLMKGRQGNANGAIYTKIRNEDSIDTSSYSILDGDELPKNTWLFITSVVDFMDSYTIKLYINGVLQSSSDLVDFDFSNSDVLYLTIGARAGIYGYPMEEYHNGLIDEVCIYNKALSDEEIKSLFEEPFEIKFLFGQIDNLNTVSDYIITFEAEKLRVIEFSPFQYLQYNSNEKINVLDKYLGVITNKFIIGFYKIYI